MEILGDEIRVKTDNLTIIDVCMGKSSPLFDACIQDGRGKKAYQETLGYSMKVWKWFLFTPERANERAVYRTI